MHAIVRTSLMVLICACAPPVLAQAPATTSVEAQVISSESFLAAHPDLRYRLLGMEAWKKQDYRKALVHFQRAARYADKPSQAMLAEMHWRGEGVPVNRPLAHAWMDLAAERKFELMLVHRERYWRQLDPAQQREAVQLGKPLQAEYGDRAAKPRLERVLRRARAATTGSRTGAVGALTIIVPGPAGDIRLDGSQFYQDKFWQPDAYWAWQAEEWRKAPEGRVDVGPLQEASAP